MKLVLVWRRVMWGLRDVVYWHRARCSNYRPTGWNSWKLDLLIRRKLISGKSYDQSLQVCNCSELVVLTAVLVQGLGKIGGFTAGKDIPLFLWTRVIHYGARKGLPLHTILNQLIAAHTLTPSFSCLSWCRLVSTFQLHSRLFKWSTYIGSPRYPSSNWSQ